MRGEVEFDSGLDDLFRVRTNKSRLAITPLLSSLLENSVGPTLAKVKRDHEEDSFDQIKQFKDIDIETQAESLARQASHLLPSPPITEDEMERATEHRRLEMERAIEDTTKKIDVEINAILYRQTRANAEDDDTTYDWAGGVPGA